MTESNVMYCYVHPTRETSLRCKRCERPICASCAVRTPTGYLCKECVRIHQKSFDTAETIDFILGFLTAAFLSGVASFLVTLIGFIGFFSFIILFVGVPAMAAIITEAVRYATRKHRSRPLFITVVVGIVIGALPLLVSQIFILNVFGIIFQAIYLFITVPFVYTRLAGIQLNR